MRAINNAMRAAGSALVRGIRRTRFAWGDTRKVSHALANAARVRQIIDNLPYHNARQTLEDIRRWLSSIHDASAFTLELRYALISEFDRASRASRRQALEEYCALRESDPVQVKRTWKTLTEFWTQLGGAYLGCATRCSAGDLSRAMQAQLPVIAARGLRALRHQMQWRLLRYGTVRRDLWEECGTFLRLAESPGAPSGDFELYEGAQSRTSPADEFLRLVMFWTLSPYSLAPQEQAVAARLVVYLTRKFQLSPWQDEASDYFFDLGGQHPPLRLVRSSPWSPDTRYIDITEAWRAVRAMHAAASGSGYLLPDLQLGAGVEAATVVRVLNHLLVNWARELPPRALPRRQAAMTIQVVHGYRDVLALLAPQHADQAPAADAYDTYDTWRATDASAGGYGAVVPAGAEVVGVGSLLALRSPADTAWQLGIVRRLHTLGHSQRMVGIQIISVRATPVQVRTVHGVAHGGRRMGALLLDTQPAPDGSMNLLVRRDLLSGADAVEADYADTPGGAPRTLILEPAGLAESGDDFDWLRYHLPPRVS